MWQAPQSWKDEALAAMATKGITRAELSRRIGVSDAAITILFRAETRTSRLVPAINRVLGLTAPVQSTGDADELRAELEQHWKELDDDDRRALTDLAKKLARTKR
jgi:hypothetical protein